jgi:hypothetical protein
MDNCVNICTDWHVRDRSIGRSIAFWESSMRSYLQLSRCSFSAWFINAIMLILLSLVRAINLYASIQPLLDVRTACSPSLLNSRTHLTVQYNGQVERTYFNPLLQRCNQKQFVAVVRAAAGSECVLQVFYLYWVDKTSRTATFSLGHFCLSFRRLLCSWEHFFFVLWECAMPGTVPGTIFSSVETRYWLYRAWLLVRALSLSLIGDLTDSSLLIIDDDDRRC